jgi:oxygen-independent coproporphyrinogen-3 oxidase
MKGVYLHIPFCRVHCPYCDFNAYAGMDDLSDRYVEALEREIQASSDGSKVSTIYFGGGTPSRLEAPAMKAILRRVGDSFDVLPDAEVSFEANPEDVVERYCADLRDEGFNRISIGTQSLSDRILRMLGRGHGGRQAHEAIRVARNAGFERVNADLIFGTPGESAAEWRESLEGVVDAGANHISCYALTVEEGTPLSTWVLAGRFPPPDDDEQADKYEFAITFLESHGFHHYEVSNWAKPGLECRHNSNYWKGGDYLGFGAGAHSHINGRRSWNVRNPRTYITLSPEVEAGFEQLAAGRRIEEAAMLALRTDSGIDRNAFTSRWDVDPFERWDEELKELLGLELVQFNGNHLRPTTKGFLLNAHISRTLLTLEDAVRGS